MECPHLKGPFRNVLLPAALTFRARSVIGPALVLHHLPVKMLCQWRGVCLFTLYVALILYDLQWISLLSVRLHQADLHIWASALYSLCKIALVQSCPQRLANVMILRYGSYSQMTSHNTILLSSYCTAWFQAHMLHQQWQYTSALQFDDVRRCPYECNCIMLGLILRKLDIGLFWPKQVFTQVSVRLIHVSHLEALNQ